MDSTAENDHLIQLEIGDIFDMRIIDPASGEMNYFENVNYEGKASFEEVDELREEGHLGFLIYDINREDHHLVWIGNKLYVNDFLYMSFMDEEDLEFQSATRIAEA